MNRRGPEMVIGLIAAGFGVMTGYMAYTMRDLSPMLMRIPYGTLVTISILTGVFSLLGAAGAVWVRRSPMMGGVIMILCGIGVIIAMRQYDTMGGVMLIVAGILAIVRRNRTESAEGHTPA